MEQINDVDVESCEVNDGISADQFDQEQDSEEERPQNFSAFSNAQGFM